MADTGSIATDEDDFNTGSNSFLSYRYVEQRLSQDNEYSSW